MNNETTNTQRSQMPGRYRPSLRFYHPNGKGSGAALEMNLHPAHDNVNGCIMMKIASQCAIGDPRGATPTFARFDWENAICVKLDFDDLCRVLQVFRGECESIDGDRGIYHQTSRAATKIKLRHLVEPISGYSLEVYRNSRVGDTSSYAHIILSPVEALGLGEAIAGSMAVVAFGIPMLVEHDTSAYEAQERRFRDVSAA